MAQRQFHLNLSPEGKEALEWLAGLLDISQARAAETAIREAAIRRGWEPPKEIIRVKRGPGRPRNIDKAAQALVSDPLNDQMWEDGEET